MRSLLVAATVCAGVFVFVSCGSTTNCTTGCVDSAGACVAGSATSACGTAGDMCSVCSGTQICNAGACVDRGSGGGTATGGGSSTGGMVLRAVTLNGSQSEVITGLTINASGVVAVGACDGGLSGVFGNGAGATSASTTFMLADDGVGGFASLTWDAGTGVQFPSSVVALSDNTLVMGSSTRGTVGAGSPPIAPNGFLYNTPNRAGRLTRFSGALQYNVDNSLSAATTDTQHPEQVAVAGNDIAVVGTYDGGVQLSGTTSVTNTAPGGFFLAYRSSSLAQITSRTGRYLVTANGGTSRGTAVSAAPSGFPVFAVGQGEGGNNYSFGGGQVLPATTRFVVIDQSVGAASLVQLGTGWPQAQDRIAASPLGGAWLAGTMLGDFTPPGQSALTHAGGGDVFLLQLTNGGAVTQALRFGDAQAQSLAAIAIDASGNVFIVGAFSGTLDFGGGVSLSAATQSGFVAKLSSTGAAQWAKSFGGAGQVRLTTVAVRGTLLWVGGDATATGTLSSGGGAITVTGERDAFLLQLSP